MNAIKSAFVMFAVLFVAACQDTASIIASKKDAVVVVASEKLKAEGEEKSKNGLGTGWFLEENVIITNFHVAGNAKEIRIASEFGDLNYEAELVYGDEFTDIAVLRVKKWDEFKEKFKPVYLHMITRDNIRVAEEVYAIGHPWGLFWSVSRGIVSSVVRKMDQTPNYFLQTDAHVFNGNSGGPLLNKSGDVIAMNSMMIVNSGGSYGIAIPSSIIQKVLKDFKKYGEVRWATVGLLLDDSTEIDVRIKEIVPNKPAATSGLMAGDIIDSVYIDGKVYKFKNATELVTLIGLNDYQLPIIFNITRQEYQMKIRVFPTYNPSNLYKKPEPPKPEENK